jgi:hypothetical protein
VTHSDWVGTVATFFVVFGYYKISERLDKIAKLLETANRQQSATAEQISRKLDGANHNLSLIRERTAPGQETDWDA